MAIGVSTSHQFVQDKFIVRGKNGNWSFNESSVRSGQVWSEREEWQLEFQRVISSFRTSSE